MSPRLAELDRDLDRLLARQVSGGARRRTNDGRQRQRGKPQAARLHGLIPGRMSGLSVLSALSLLSAQEDRTATKTDLQSGRRRRFRSARERAYTGLARGRPAACTACERDFKRRTADHERPLLRRVRPRGRRSLPTRRAVVGRLRVCGTLAPATFATGALRCGGGRALHAHGDSTKRARPTSRSAR